MFRCVQDSKDRSKSMHVRHGTRSVTGPMPIEIEGRIGRLLWASLDHKEHEQKR
jgi:hypothetical protein